MDRISKERILKQLDTENFNSFKYLKEEYNQFKGLLGGKIPYNLLDYFKYEGAPNPLRFINYSKTYQSFLQKVEKTYTCKELLDNDFYRIIKELSDKLPIKRPYEFAIIKSMINKKYININDITKIMEKYIENPSKDTIIHALNNLNQEYYDQVQLNNYLKMFDYSNGILTKTLIFTKILRSDTNKNIILDIINYGLSQYQKNFEYKNYGLPFFKLYAEYQMTDVALLSNYTKKHSAFRGSGLLANKNEYFLFVDLHKEENIKESIDYNDKFLNRHIFQWQTPNTTTQKSERGKNIIENKKRNVNLHLFVRKCKRIDNKVQPYIYIGKADTIHYYGEKPITVQLELHHKIKENIYTEFIHKVML